MTATLDERVPLPAVARTRVGHRRTRPFDYAFRHRSTSWLVDADDAAQPFPRALRRVLTVRAEDHLGTGTGTLGDKLRRHLHDRGLDWDVDRVLVLANARTFGHVFDPLTTYFCFGRDGELTGVMAEVHNTYGEAHCYPLEVDRRGRTSMDKEFYVSPFFAVEGRYDIRAQLTAARVSVSITLTQEDVRVFSGHVVGELEPATRSRVWRAFARDPLASQRVSFLIRWHGIKLWLRRLPVVPRPRHTAKGPA